MVPARASSQRKHRLEISQLRNPAPFTATFFWLLSVLFPAIASAEGEPRWEDRQPHPLLPCAGPLAQPAPALVTASGVWRACLDYTRPASVQAQLQFRGNDGAGDWRVLADLGEDQPGGAPARLRLLDRVGTPRGADLIAVLVETAPDAATPGCPAPAYLRYVRSYVVGGGKALSMTVPQPTCVSASLQTPEVWVRFVGSPDRANAWDVLQGEGPPPRQTRLEFGMERDGRPFRTFPFSL